MLPLNAAPQPQSEHLQHAGLFRGLALPALAEVEQLARQRAIQSDAFFFHQGDPATTLYVLVQGRVRIAQVTPEGQQVILHIISTGEIFGGIAALGDASYPASAEALEASIALAWESESIAGLMEEYPRIALNALRLLAGRYQEMQDRYRELATERVERRVARTLLRLLRQTGRKVENGVLIDFPLSREDLAELTGTTLYTVSRILSRWEKDGLVETGRQRVLIRIPHKLVVIAEDLLPGQPSDIL
ncbi:MAG TPA: Crp/Fnr family transcriptional regulator [Caldilineaceae bacterium]|nr:Crp/Fnr family transcriptional regulator [Caldilineaceae bacterium]